MASVSFDGSTGSSYTEDVMDDILTFAAEVTPPSLDSQPPWKILISDDEPSVHLVTRLALGDFRFESRSLELLSSYGEADTRKLLTDHPDIAVVLLDVVMETEDSGFSVVRYIRETLGNRDIRIIMRTGQSGSAPEDRIIIDYDINDFKDKTELTVAKLRTTLISSLRTYSHLKIIAEEQRKTTAHRAYLGSVLDSLSSVLIAVDLDLRVLLWNRQAQLWTGLGAEVVTGCDLFEVAPVFRPLKALFLQLATSSFSADQPPVERNAVPLWNEGQVFVHLTLQKLEGANGPEILFRLDDRTAAKWQDDQAVRSHRVNVFSTLAAEIARELPLFIQAAGTGPERALGHRISSLLTRLAGFSPLGDLGRKVLDWSAAVGRTLVAMPVPETMEMRFVKPSTPAWVRASPSQLTAIVSQLLQNALDACADGRKGVICVAITKQQGADLELGPGEPGHHYWCLTVEDHGIGMSAEVVEQVFDPYFTTKPENVGLGLGLPLVYSLVEDLGGFVTVRSRLGESTTVQVALPAAKGDEATPEPRSWGKILVCDDEPVLRNVVAKILRNQGFEVIEAGDGPAALELFHAQADTIRLVILDMILPGRPGLEVFREIHRQAPHIPVLLSSGFGRGTDVDQAMAQGVVGFLQKPYTAARLAQEVRTAMGRNASGQAS